jgi:hypothetical protein
MDPQVRHSAVATLAVLGSSTNRFRIRGQLEAILKATTQGPLVSSTISGLRESGESQWVLSDADADDYPGALRGWLRELNS